MQLTAAGNSFPFKASLKMETECLLRGMLLLLLLSSSICGQGQQPPYSKFLPDLFSTFHSTLGSFNHFSYLPRPMGPYPATGYRPRDVNIAYSNTFRQLVPQQPVFQLTGPRVRIRQKVPLPTPPSVRDEVRPQHPPMPPLNSDVGVSPQKYPAPQPPLAELPKPPDNRHFNDVRLVQPPSAAASENGRKEIPMEKFHKPVRVDAAFGGDDHRQSVLSPIATASNPGNTFVRRKRPYVSYSSETLVVKAKHNNASSSHIAQTTRVPPLMNKERPFDRFKPMTTHTKAYSRGQPIPPQFIDTHKRPLKFPGSGNAENFQKKLPGSIPRESNIPLVTSDSISHSVYVKPPEQSEERPTISKEERRPQGIPDEPLPLPSSSPPPKEIQSDTEKPKTDSDTSTNAASEELGEENASEKTVTEIPLPQKEEDPLVNEASFSETKSLILPNEVGGFDDTTSMNYWAFGDNKVLTGTPEEILSLKLADAINNFGFGLYRRMEETNNLFFSPLSLSAALAIVLEGTSNMTALQILNGLHFTESNIRPDEVKAGFKRLMRSLKSKRSDYQFENANLLLLQNKFFLKSEFSNTVYKHYKPLLGSVDFAGNGINIKRNVNDWVNRRTHGKIEEFLTDQLPSETVFVVLNAVYFRGQWVNPFDPILTATGLFYNYGKEPVETTMMKQIGTFPVGYSANLNAQVIELPYESEETSMVIVLPEELDGIYQLKNKLNYQELYVILSAIDFQLVQLSLPRFSLRGRYDMEDVLKEMGMKDVFIPGKANFGRMTNVTGLYLSKVSHEGVIDVDEKGTEAAVITGGFVVPLSRPLAVTVNHPFFFFIRNRNNGAILFIGQFDAFQP